MHDIIIKNGIIFDGTGKGSGRRVDLAVSGGLISEVKDLQSAAAREVINAEGLYVAPGFIDIQNHSDSHGVILNNPGLESLVLQGVTTVVLGQCGASLAPLPGPQAVKSLQKWGTLEGVNTDWQSYAEFVSKLSKRVFGVNVLSFVGHGTLRRGLTGDVSRELTADELKQMGALLERSLKEGAAGISFGFQYAHEYKTGKDEIIELLKIVKKAGKIASIHLRSEDTGFQASVQEIVDYVKNIGTSTKISHFKVEGKQNAPQLYPSLSLIEQCYQAGVDIRFDVYPYTTTWRSLYTYLSPWAYEGGFKPMLERLGDKKLRPKILTELAEKRTELGALLVSSSPRISGFVDKTINEIALSQKVPVEEALLRVISGNGGQAIVFDHDIDPGQISLLINHPLSFVASDAVGYSFKVDRKNDLPHPRCFGTFPRFLRLLRGDKEKPLLPWAEGLAKISGLPASFLGLRDRGLIKTGLAADLVVFDPKTVSDMATYTNPYRAPVGIKYVINNGKISVYEGQLTGVYNGKILK